MIWGEHEGTGWWMLFGSARRVFFWAAMIWLFVRLVGPHDRENRRFGAGDCTTAVCSR